MEQLVRIRQNFDDGTAQVVLIRESACSGDCHKCSGCGAAKQTMLVTAENPIGAAVGDLVRLSSDTAPVMKGAAVLYILPLVLFFAGYAIGQLWNIGAWIGGLGFALLSIRRAGADIILTYAAPQVAEWLREEA